MDTLITIGLWLEATDDEAFWRDTEPAWRRMADDKNPCYRLVALRMVSFWARDDAEKREVLLKALQERSDAFLVDATGMAQGEVDDSELVAAVERVAREHSGQKDPTAHRSPRAVAQEVVSYLRATAPQVGPSALP